MMDGEDSQNDILSESVLHLNRDILKHQIREVHRPREMGRNELLDDNLSDNAPASESPYKVDQLHGIYENADDHVKSYPYVTERSPSDIQSMH